MPERNKPRFERTKLPPDIARLLATSNLSEIDLKFARLEQLDTKVHALVRHFERLAEIAERMQR